MHTESAFSVAVDFGLTNIDALADTDGDFLTFEHKASVPSERRVDERQLRRALAAIGLTPPDAARICVTGGQHRKLPDVIDGTPVVKVGEIDAIGYGGLYLAQQTLPDLREALIVSAGSGTAVLAVRDSRAHHVTGSAVGGGTLLGLGKLLVGVNDPNELNDLALAGDSNKVDLTLIEATGGAIGTLPADANAVNFGRMASLGAADVTREDLAAGIAVLVGQVIAVVAINAARAEQMDQIVVVGHLVDLLCIRRVLHTVAGYYGANIMVPPMPGYATAVGALLH